MSTPFAPTTFGAIASHLTPEDIQALALENAPSDMPVMWHEGDLELDCLDLAALNRTDEEESESTSPTHLHCIVVHGTLRATGAVLGERFPRQGTRLLVLGDLYAAQVLLHNEMLCIRGNLHVREFLWGEEAPGNLLVQGRLHSPLALFSNGFSADWQGTVDCEWIIAPEHLQHQLSDPTGYRSEALVARIVPHCVNRLAHPESTTEPTAATLLNRDAMLDVARQGQSLLRPASECPPLLAPDAALCAGDAITIDNIRALVYSRLVPRSAKRVQTWFGQTDYALCQRHVDQDGDQRQDSVYITIWKRWDFYLGVTSQPLYRNLLERLAVRLGLGQARMQDQLHMLYRRYDENGNASSWETLEDHSPRDIHEACHRAWQGVLAQAREDMAQIHAGHPLWGALQRLTTPERIEKLTTLPIFTEQYNDWWDSDRNGFWQQDLWMGARQPTLRNGHQWGRAFKLSWVNGEPVPGDDEDNQHSCYQLDLDTTREDQPWVRVSYSQRQDCDRDPLPHHAAGHLLRLMRFFSAAEQHLQQQHALHLAQQEKAAHIAATARLLVRPPVSADRPDTEIFPAELMALSDQWRTQGGAYMALIRRHQLTMDADESTEELPPIPEKDPRTPHNAMALQLARVVHRSHDPGLAQRFRKLFPFSANAALEDAREVRQCVSAAFWLNDTTTLARIEEPWRENCHWVLLKGQECINLDHLQGAGRSPDRQCWAVHAEGVLTTRRGFDGTAIATFALPQGNEGLPTTWELAGNPLAQRCDELIPFNDGQRVLLRNPTGIYLLDAHGVRRLHPQNLPEDAEDESSPYTWPKNRSDEALSMDMLHMALSPDERWIALGDQDSAHLLLSTHDWKVRRSFEPRSSYPHHTAFTHDSTALLANACHFYEGSTGVWPVTAESGAEPIAEPGPWRIYASTSLPDMVVVGEAHGYLHALAPDMRPLWGHHIGSTLSALDASPDGTTLIAGSYGGYLVCLQHQGTHDPYSIGTSPYHEAWRWIFWSNETAPLRW